MKLLNAYSALELFKRTPCGCRLCVLGLSCLSVLPLGCSCFGVLGFEGSLLVRLSLDGMSLSRVRLARDLACEHPLPGQVCLLPANF